MKLAKIIIPLLMLGCLASCGGGTEASTNPNGSIPNTSQTNSNSTSQDTRAVITSLDEVCDYLVEKGVVTGEKSSKSASMIGAVEGCGYSEQGVELYMYESEAPKSFVIFGITMSFDVTNGNFALCFSSGSKK